MIGKKNEKKPDTAEGRTPDTIAKEVGEAAAHLLRKGTKSWRPERFARTETAKRGTVLKKQTSVNHKNPIVFFLMIAASVLFIFSQIYKT